MKPLDLICAIEIEEAAVGRSGRNDRSTRRERGEGEWEKQEDRRDRERGDEADQRRVESHEAGSVPFSRSQAPIPFGSVAVSFASLQIAWRRHREKIMLAVTAIPNERQKEKSDVVYINTALTQLNTNLVICLRRDRSFWDIKIE